jgi:pimeloyl-ACP methyl ester carboxylesterase
MRRGWKILIGVLVALALLLALNKVIVDNETKGAAVTEPGGRILALPGGELQVVEHGPRGGSPIVLLHCFSCAINWWGGMVPLLAREHRVIALDLLGFGGSEKPSSGYAMENQATLVAQALDRLGVRGATVVGHSLGGTVATALAEQSPGLVAGLVIIDQAPDNSFESGGLPFTAELTFLPVAGEALWRITPDFAVREGLGTAFAPGFDVPDEFVDDFRRMTYTSYHDSPGEEDDYTAAIPLDRRIARTGKPLLAIFGAEDQIYDPRKALAAYASVPGAGTKLVAGAGHSPNVEAPAVTARLVLRFAKRLQERVRSGTRGGAVSSHETKRRSPPSPSPP